MPSTETRPGPERWIGPLALMGCLWWVSGHAIATPPGTALIRVDLIAHVLVFGLLATALARSPLPGSARCVPWSLAALLASLYGLLDEWHQSWVPARTFDPADAAADIIGAYLAAAVYRFWPAYRRFWETTLFQKRKKG
ncbi:MAG: VanZ family protein [Opitutales bacterium]